MKRSVTVFVSDVSVNLTATRFGQPPQSLFMAPS
eukprot:CAMPEP_0198110528 /NCGR_PEP_ID=MMETSP1442-20131203/2546_1 /TAXON_ID= /ORGANISM="Craspedostauros australis, Strain CCMP3328" /LENGTH=33 /DNA_ID= /DNA_START= /DNA_END= /DNA_ORIENTATION=